VPSGSYRVRGKLRMLDGGAFDLVLDGERWTNQPPGYIMVGLTARSDKERRSMRGQITHESCKWVEVARVE
jgi:hypothetical protein